MKGDILKNALTADKLKIPGYYWWLPEAYKEFPTDDNNWTITSWHPLNNRAPKSGYFIGPLKSPAEEWRTDE